jgi:hypothetical protein
MSRRLHRHALMLHHVKANLNALRAFLARLRRRGYGSAAALLYLVPVAASGRLYAKFAGAVNAFLLAPGFNQRRFRRFQQQHAAGVRGHVYLIVMPRMLHFLIPCVRLIPPDVPVIFIGNGQSAWEEEQVRALRPDAPFSTWRRFRTPASPTATSSTCCCSTTRRRSALSITTCTGSTRRFFALRNLRPTSACAGSSGT